MQSEPANSPADLNRQLQTAIAHHRANRLNDAEELYSDLLKHSPDQAQVLHLLGLVYQQTDRCDEAIELIQRSVHIKPDSPEALNNLAVSLQQIGRLNEAADACRRAILLRPNYAQAHINLGNALRHKRKLVESIRIYQQGIYRCGASAEFLCRLAAALIDHNDLDEALLVAQQAIELDSASAEAHQLLGHALKSAGEINRAIASYSKAIELNPGDPALHSNLIYALHFSPSASYETIRAELRLWEDRHAGQFKHATSPSRIDSIENRRIRLGYVSPNFCAHNLAIIALPIFRGHDRRRFEIYCYSDVMCPDEFTKQFRQQTDHWRSIVGRTDEQAADQIRTDRIDILVDLNLHLPRNRLLLFARKPAPIQATWFGYPGSTGLTAIDYRLTDWHLDASGEVDTANSERFIRLPDSFWCYKSPDQDIPVNALPAQTTGKISFGCLNSFSKVNPVALGIFAKVLNRLPDSALLMLCPSQSGQTRVRSIFHQLGVDPIRIEFAGFQSRADYLRTYHRIDISLDTIPYNGHTTTMDSLWMGVPVVTRAGHTAVGRGGKSILSNLGFANLIAGTDDEYVEIAAELAGQIEPLASMRATLRDRMAASPLMDIARFTGNLEAAYTEMIANHGS